MELLISTIVGIVCLIDKKFDKKNIIGEMLNAIMYLFIIMVAVVAVDYVLFGARINVFSYDGRLFRVIANVTTVAFLVLCIKYFRIRNGITKKGKRVYLFVATTCAICFISGLAYDIYAKDSIVINEVSSNNFIYYDEDNEYSGDYIELYNPSYTAVSLDGYVLSDEDYTCDLSEYVIPARGYLVLSTSSIEKKLEFGISASGEKIVLKNNGKEVDSVELPAMEKDSFYMRDKNGLWINVVEATPNQSNENAISNKVPTLNEPTFSLGCGFYDEPIEVEITTEYENCKIYYTLNGSEPTTESLLYDGPIKLSDYSEVANKYSAIKNTTPHNNYLPNYLVDKGNVLKALVVSEVGEKSPVVANTYFVGFDDKSGYENVMIMSMVIDENDFFSDEKGIYVLGRTFNKWIETQDSGIDISVIPGRSIPANYFIRGNKSERNVHIELFDIDRRKIEESECIVKIHGGASRAYSNKTLSIDSECESSMFYNNEYMLRSGGAMFTEVLTQALVSDRNIGVQDDIGACALFINGEYWGTYMVQERCKEKYFENEYGVTESNLIAIKNNAVDIGSEEDRELYKELLRLCCKDCTIEENYNNVCDAIDKQSLIDYFCYNLYIGNSDWPYNNYSCWRSKFVVDGDCYQDGKWRWNVFDVDFASTTLERNTFSEEVNTSKKKPLNHPIISQLIKNESFKKDFVNTFMDLANYNLSPDIVCPKIDTMKELYITSIVKNGKRFNSEEYNIEDAEKSLDIRYDFYINRFDYIVPIMASELGLSGTIEEVVLEVNDIDGGNISLNTITPEMKSDGKWTGKYYTDYTVTVTANPNEGYRFVGWEGTYTEIADTMEVVIIPGGVTVKAIFEKIN